MTSPARDWAASIAQHRERRAAVAAAREALGMPASGQLDLDTLVLAVARLKAEVAELRQPVRSRLKAAARALRGDP
jgi:hypothetical protein